MLDFCKLNKFQNPLQTKFDSGELKAVNRWDIPDEEWNAKMSLLNDEERETANWYRQEKLQEKYADKKYILCCPKSCYVIKKLLLPYNSAKVAF